jgi:hypothetical protein
VIISNINSVFTIVLIQHCLYSFGLAATLLSFGGRSGCRLDALDRRRLCNLIFRIHLAAEKPNRKLRLALRSVSPAALWAFQKKEFTTKK